METIHKIGRRKTAVARVYLKDGSPGGQRSLTATQLFEKDPTRLVENAVKGMLPKNKLGAALFRNMRVFVGGEHSLDAQKPEVININDLV